MPTSTDTDCVIRLDSLSMLYPTKSGGTVQALDDVSLSVRAGEFISIVGPSGCGKSTLLRIIMGLSRQTSGQVTFEASGDTHRNQLGMVFQMPHQVRGDHLEGRRTLGRQHQQGGGVLSRGAGED